MKKTFLYEKHLELNAKMVDFSGWQMPIQYKNLKEEVLAVRQNVGVFDVSHMGEFLLTGKDALSFVDYLVPNDIKEADINKAIYSPLCREDGTIIDDLIIYKLSETKILICVNAANIEKDYNWIKDQIGKRNVKLSDLSKNYSLLALQGPNSYETLKSIDMTSMIRDIDYYSIQVFNESNVPFMFARTGYTGEDGFEIFADHQFISKLWDKLIKAGVTPCGLGARDVLRLEVCYPLYGNELSDKVTPLDSSLKWTVKMYKSDFIGRTALVDYTAKSRLIKLQLDKGIPRSGYFVLNSNKQPIGVITSGSMSVMLEQGIAIARVDKNLYQNEEELFVEIRSKHYNAKVVKKAFYSGGHK
ncbi:MAG: glycine cleavage system aminomethyltransferase GcvT [Bacteriovoracaceae bacterium]|jgi:aminomethyltransferase|nr:glycine cleavage system aminomethyltransferase GcvT [Bacteriovoracaceae bacterium]